MNPVDRLEKAREAVQQGRFAGTLRLLARPPQVTRSPFPFPPDTAG